MRLLKHLNPQVDHLPNRNDGKRLSNPGVSGVERPEVTATRFAVAVFSLVFIIVVVGHAQAENGPTSAGTGQNGASQARALEKSGKTAEAYADYKKWLALNPDNAVFGSTLIHASQLAPTIADGLSLLREGVAHIQNPSERGAVYATMGADAELSGDIEHAQQYYETAYNESPPGGTKDYSSLLHSAQLLFELGKLNDAVSRAKVIEAAIPAAAPGPAAAIVVGAELLSARVEREQHGALAGLAAASPLLGREGAGPAVYLFVIDAAHAAGKGNEAARVFAELQKRYGSSPEVTLAAGLLGRNEGSGNVDYLPSPSRLLTPLSAAELSSAKPATQATQQAAPAQAPDSGGAIAQTSGGGQAVSIAVQTGAFRDKANATKLIGELTRKGYQPTMLPSNVYGAVFYRVIVPVTVEGARSPTDAAHSLLDRLRADGFDGFLVPN